MIHIIVGILMMIGGIVVTINGFVRTTNHDDAASDKSPSIEQDQLASLSKDDLTSAVLRRISLSSFRPENPGTAIDHAERRKQIDSLRAWATSLPKSRVRAEYLNWCDFYERNVYDAERGALGKSYADKSAEQQERIRAVQDFIPTPPITVGDKP